MIVDFVKFKDEEIMRIKITINTEQNNIIPINSNYYISSLIYSYLKKSSIRFSTYLHRGLHIEGTKKFKFFTFSRIFSQKYEVRGENLIIKSRKAYFYISSPWHEFIQNLVNGLLQIGEVVIQGKRFPIEVVESEKNKIEDIFTSDIELKLKPLSPFVVTSLKERNGKLLKYYYKPDDDPCEISKRLEDNLKKKYESFYNQRAGDIKVILDKESIKKKNSKVLIHYKKEGLDIKIPAIFSILLVKGDINLIKFGYDCGFGELNSQGFGMMEVC